MSSRKKAFLFLSVIIILGAFRDFFFVQWNEQARVTYYKTNDSHVYFFMKWLELLPYAALYYGKFILTTIFIALFLFFNIKFLNSFFRRNTKKTVTIAFLVTAILSVMFFLLDYLLPIKLYPVSRFLAGVLESPQSTMILFIAFYLDEYEKSRREN